MRAARVPDRSMCVRQKSWRRNPAALPALGISADAKENHGSKGSNGSAHTANQVRVELRNVSRETQDFRFFRLFRGGILACSTAGGTTEDTEWGRFEVTCGCCSSVSSVRSVVFTNFPDARTPERPTPQRSRQPSVLPIHCGVGDTSRFPGSKRCIQTFWLVVLC